MCNQHVGVLNLSKQDSLVMHQGFMHDILEPYLQGLT